MPVIRLITKRVEKPWGRHDLWPGFEAVPEGGAPIGEIWFQAPPEAGEGDPDLLIKYLFTSEKLSIQVHPDDADAVARGFERGKSEAWQILSAEPHATIGLGMTRPMTQEELRASALDGTIEDLLDWKAVKPGEFWYSPAGTVHAIGPGLVLIEIQQNVDLTYRLYDYSRPRELHLDDGVAVSNPVPYVAPFQPVDLAPGRRILAAEGKFVTERWTAPHQGRLAGTRERPLWLIPLAGSATAGDERIAPGGVWLVDSDAPFAADPGIDLLVAYPGGAVNEALLG
ncbi:class I mannose-6-phosphate isomerase [Sphingomonas morindae]|uniref:Class I mannose-6-phosphate isomerase n=1 Tax=Sphingomonas morindae TaxID=1541170 RepID=A0ABY4X9K3_9SPHN|nr:class I mannose-6-phosphate isomerase [Sphingomonas morindae]USI73618.1 class I mannose-6-phosphate isomerase [Sphingomonas morindae]